jgi:transposase
MLASAARCIARPRWNRLMQQTSDAIFESCRSALSCAGRRVGRRFARHVAYRDRNTVERTINKLRCYRAVAMRTDKRDYLYRGIIDVASIRIWLRDPVRHDP